MIRIYIARTAREMHGLRPLWLELERARGLTLYQSFRWNYTAAAMLAPHPCVVAVENRRGAAIIPTAIGSGSLTFLGDALFDYRDVLSNDDDALATAWRVVAEMGRPLRFTALRADSPHAFWSADVKPEFCGAPSISLDDVSAEQFAQRHWRQAKQVRRLYREGAKLVRTDGTNSEFVRWIYQQKAAQLAGDPNNIFADPRRIRFMLEIAAQEGSCCEVFCFQIGEAIVSSLITFRDQQPGRRCVRRYYTTTFDGRFERLSPGIALLYEVARLSLAEGLDVDMQTGEQFHKSRLATRSTQLYRMAASPAQMLGYAEGLAGSVRAAA